MQHADSRDALAAPLSFGLCAGYGVGALGISILLNTVTVYFPAMMTTVLGQSAGLAGLLLTLSKIYDAFADIAIGAISDRTKTRIGRRRPFLLLGAALGAASFFWIFVPPDLHGWALTAWMLFGLIIYSTGYSLFTVPFTAMAGEMTDDYHERTKLQSFRTFFISAGQIASGAGTAWIITEVGGGKSGYAVMGSVAGAALAMAFIASFFGTRTARMMPATVSAHIGKIAALRTMWSNKPFVLLMTIKLFQYTGIAMITTTKLLFLLNVVKVGYGGFLQLTLVQNIVMAGSLPLWVPIARRIGKRPAYLVATGLLVLLYISWYFTGPGIAMWEIWARGVLNGVAAAGTTLISIAMLPDVMEFDRLRTGLRREGVFSSVYTIVEKLGYALGAGVIGALLAAAGYIPTMQGKLVTQPAAAVGALYAGASLVPAGIVLVSFILMLFYRLDQRKLRETAMLEVAA
jgi:GPH family glycoside/pentoside/hexuronide:cation symporter